MRRARHRATDWRTTLPLAGGAVVLGLGALYGIGLVTAGDAVAAGTHVHGVDIGGLSPSAARTALDKGLGPAAAAPIGVRVGDRTEQISPSAFGLSVDTDATVRAAAPGGRGPVEVIGRLLAPTREREVEPVVRMDPETGRAAVAKLAAAQSGPRDGAVRFEAGKAVSTAPAGGVVLREQEAAEAVRSAYLKPRTGPVELPVNRTTPTVDAAETERALREFARPAMSGPVTLTLGSGAVRLSPELIGAHLSLRPDGAGRLAPHLDAERLLAEPAVARAVSAQSHGAARVTAVDLRESVMPLLTKTGSAARTGPLTATVVPPGMTAEEARRLGIKEEVSSFTVKFPAAPYRTTNVRRAAELIDGSLVRPGETWSFNKTVGERTEENGFVDGIMINDGRYVKSPGGGVSAVATTMFNAAFFAGVKPVEYGAHSFYIERYPEGREATVAWGTLDLRWLNDTGNALYVRAESTDTSVTITLLGTKKYDEIRAVKGPRTKVVPPGKQTVTGPTCEVQTPLEGFDVSVDRIFVKGGEAVRKETFRTHYTPRDEVVCAPEPSPTASAPAGGEAAPASGTPAAPGGPTPAKPAPAATGSGAPRE
ncbi:VanW family protein [Streptomyces sp. NPDC097619]|uniref:VanW family protein n=1 Tax=Streptomyces sp. NPDC097619 TaxID=3157228 RepID=UPI0033258C59